MEDCVFCKIIEGIKEGDKIWEDEDFLAILDINPCAKGHLMIIPKRHSRWVWDMDREEYLNYMDRVRYLARVLRKAFETDCIQEAIVGMDVAHSHVHLLPRVEGDGFDGISIVPMSPRPSSEEMGKIADRIRNAINLISRNKGL
jgi:histidine triad (HIT) family protein